MTHREAIQHVRPYVDDADAWWEQYLRNTNGGYEERKAA
jgi:hypothetical protein